MAFIGTESAGYRISTSDERCLEIESWGFWDVAMASAFEAEALSACQRVQQLQSLDWNAADMKPQAEHGRVAIHNLMALLSARNISDCQIVADNILTMMQLRRIARESGLHLANIRDSWT